MAISSRSAGKLVGLMRWVELGDGASYLSCLMGESIGREDILRLALEGHLTLSVRFVGAVTALCGRAEPAADVERHQIPLLNGEGTFHWVNGTPIPDTDKVIVYDDRIRSIVDVWDLPMLGGERLSVENAYEIARLRNEHELFSLEGAFVTDSMGLYCKLMERFEGELGRRHANSPFHPDHYYPAAALPQDCILVVRTKVLEEFARRFNTDEPDRHAKPLGSRERGTLLTIIAALARLAKVDVSRPSSAATAIESETERMGTRVAARTIENHLKLVPDALEAREK